MLRGLLNGKNSKTLLTRRSMNRKAALERRAAASAASSTTSTTTENMIMLAAILLAAPVVPDAPAAATVPAAGTRQCVLAVAGEAGGECFAAQVAVAAAIQNRACDLRTVYGWRNRLAKHADAATLATAARAWATAAEAAADPAHGCRYFGGPDDAVYFRRIRFVPVFHVGHITFYRPPTKTNNHKKK